MQPNNNRPTNQPTNHSCGCTENGCNCWTSAWGAQGGTVGPRGRGKGGCPFHGARGGGCQIAGDLMDSPHGTPRNRNPQRGPASSIYAESKGHKGRLNSPDPKHAPPPPLLPGTVQCTSGVLGNSITKASAIPKGAGNPLLGTEQCLMYCTASALTTFCIVHRYQVHFPRREFAC